MSAPGLIRRGATGEPVRDLQERLTALGHPVTSDEPGDFGPATEAAVRSFQEARGLHVDGICGRETWGALVEAGFRLGDRLLYLRRPMLRGDDVAELQERLNALGFDAGREDGIFGARTETALRDFQLNAGIAADGVCGPATRSTLDRLGSLAAGSVASVREREILRRVARRLDGQRIYVAVEPGLEVVAGALERALRDTGAQLVVDLSGRDDSELAAEANRFDADMFLGVRAGDQATQRACYFATRTFRSEGGFLLAERIDEELAGVLGPSAGPAGKAYRILRETRMPAVVCTPSVAGDAAATHLVVSRAPEVGAAIARGVRRGVEEPLDASR